MSFYRKQGRSEKYLELLDRFDEKLKLEAKKYHQKILDEVAEGNRNNYYAALRKLENGGNFSKKCNFSLPCHVDENLSPTLSAERLAEYFSSISQEFEPICAENFPHGLRKGLRLDKITGKNLYLRTGKFMKS